MSPEAARVFFVEDDRDSREVTTEFLEIAGHSVIEIATTLEDALAKIPELGKKGINVAVVDGNLTEWEDDGIDGETIAKEIKAKHPNIVVIGHALEKHIKAADINCTKYEGSSKLADVITSV